jgi:hypothetical protein
MSNVRELHVEDLLGLAVRARNGRLVGHIEEIRVDTSGGRYVVEAFLLGSGALWRRLSVLRRFVSRSRTIVVRWDQIDLTEPSRPVLACSVTDLETEIG